MGDPMARESLFYIEVFLIPPSQARRKCESLKWAEGFQESNIAPRNERSPTMANDRPDKARAGDHVKSTVVHHREVSAVIEVDVHIAVPRPNAKPDRESFERVAPASEESDHEPVQAPNNHPAPW